MKEGLRDVHPPAFLDIPNPAGWEKGRLGAVEMCDESEFKNTR